MTGRAVSERFKIQDSRSKPMKTSTEQASPKPIFKSKTVLVNAAAAAAVFYPPITAVV